MQDEFFRTCWFKLKARSKRIRKRMSDIELEVAGESGDIRKTKPIENERHIL